jgi:hypothetical protein
MRKLQQVLLVQATADGDEAVTPLIAECVKRMGCGPQAVGRSINAGKEGVTVTVTLIGHAQTYDGTATPVSIAP